MGVLEGAIIGSAVLGAGASMSAADKAASAQKKATKRQIAEQRRAEQQQRADLAPWRTSGQEALGRLNDPTAFQQSPGYGFVRDEGTRGIENSFSARGSGGNAMRALAEFNAGLASQEYGNWWQRTFNQAAMGQNAAAGQATATGQAAANIGNAYGNYGNFQANNAYERASGVNNALQAGAGNYLYAQNRGLLGGGQPPGQTYGGYGGGPLWSDPGQFARGQNNLLRPPTL